MGDVLPEKRVDGLGIAAEDLAEGRVREEQLAAGIRQTAC